MNAPPIQLGRQTFDGLGRQRSVEVAGRITRYHYRAGQLPPASNTLADGQQLAYTYEPHLGNALLATTCAEGDSEQLRYHPQLALPIEASGALGTQRWHFSPSGKPHRDIWEVDGTEHLTTWQHSLNGLPLSFSDCAGIDHRYQYDEFGRLSSLTVGNVRTSLTYDAFSRPLALRTENLDSGQCLSRELSYDNMGREASSTFKVSGTDEPASFVQTLTYSNLDQVVKRTWNDGEHTGTEHFEYDIRGRLVRHTADQASAPRDPFGNVIVEQRFAFNPLDGLREVVSTFADGSQDEASFHYADEDPTQLVAISHTHASWPLRIELLYDACGRVIGDSLGRSMTWTAQDRLASVTVNGQSCHYRYNSLGQLCDREVDGLLKRSYYSGMQLTHEQQAGQKLGVVGDDTTIFALSQLDEGGQRITLLGCDSQGSIRLEAGESIRQRRYSAHGAEPVDDQHTPFGYAGQRREPLTEWNIPAGYRPYDPLLMCFLAPDSESPFGRGGINAYAYCAGDPINRIDPDGHSWHTWVLAGIGVVATIASLGSAAPAIGALLAGGALSASSALAITSAALNVVSISTGVAAMALEAQGKNQQASSVLGWISMGTGIASLGAGIASKMTGHIARPLTRAGALKNPAPRTTAPLERVNKSAVLCVSTDDAVDVAWHENLWGKGIKGFETHGGTDGTLMNAQGWYDDAVNIAIKEIAPRLANTATDEPIVLLACFGGKSGAAQRIANALQRPVYGYDKAIYIHDPHHIQMLKFNSFGTTVPTQKISAWRRFQGAKGLDFNPAREVASGQMYRPNG